jgi:hypothetical protein
MTEPAAAHATTSTPHRPDRSPDGTPISRATGGSPVPTGQEEEWRFTPLRRLRGLPPGGPNKITEDGRGQLRALGFNV